MSDDEYEAHVKAGDVELEYDGFGCVSTFWERMCGRRTRCIFCWRRIGVGQTCRRRYVNVSMPEFLGVYEDACLVCPPKCSRLKRFVSWVERQRVTVRQLVFANVFGFVVIAATGGFWLAVAMLSVPATILVGWFAIRKVKGEPR